MPRITIYPMKSTIPPYSGFEQGPIRPPSEASSLLIRVTRNCPWNRCTFCPVYKGETFSLRPVEHVIADIDRVRHFLDLLAEKKENSLIRDDIRPLAAGLNYPDRMALSAAVNWIRSGRRSIFLQDANSLIVKPDNLITILEYLQKCFPDVERITSYARSHTICRIADDKLATMRRAGLNRIHIGMESGADSVLALVRKGSSKHDHIIAGRKVKGACMELSEYVMPGLGGRALSQEHAIETADALNQIDCDFIRLRSLTISPQVPLAQEWERGDFIKLTDDETAREILLFLQHLQGIHSRITSDHILNLFEEIEGKLPEDKERMIGVIERFFSLPAQEQMLYKIGRRSGLFRNLTDLDDDYRRMRAQEERERFGITEKNIDAVLGEMTRRFV